jgi:hypothetical protein
VRPTAGAAAGTHDAFVVGAQTSPPRVNPAIVRALRASDVRSGIEESEWAKQMSVGNASLVNYATAPMGAKKFDASTIGR